MRPLFFGDLSGERVLLDGDEGHHAADVMRLRVGEQIDVSDNRETWVSATVTAVTKGRVEAQVIERHGIPALTPSITIAQAIAKGDAMSEAVELMSQIGVGTVLPWSAEHSISRWDGPKAQKAVERLQAVAFSAAKQARNRRITQVDTLHSHAALVGRLSEFDLVCVLHESAPESLAGLDLRLARTILLVVGPEGGLSPDELSSFGQAQIVRIGPTVLRSAHAGAIASAVVASSTWWR